MDSRGNSHGPGGYGHWKGGRGRAWRGTSRAPQPPSPPLPLGPAVGTIDVNSLLLELDSPAAEDVRYVASYNWVNGKDPVIIVPGSPPAWTPLAEDTQLKPDSEDVFRDINAARYPAYPMEPAVRAVLAMQPDFELQSLDIVACGSTIGNLLRYAGGQSRPFRFDLNVVGDTVFFIRREKSPTEIIADVRGYGHTFPEAYTTWDAEVRNSCSHQRVIQYDFGGLELLIRTETDGYLKQAGINVARNTIDASQDLSLEETLDGITVGTQEPSAASKLKIKMAGNIVPQDRIFDIKTRAGYTAYDMNEILPRLWVNQTPRFLIAYHQRGLFDKPAVASVKQQLLDWQNANSNLLARLHSLMKRIVDVARDTDHRQLEVSWDGEGLLCITRQVGEGRLALPSDLSSLWDSVE